MSTTESSIEMGPLGQLSGFAFIVVCCAASAISACGCDDYLLGGRECGELEALVDQLGGGCEGSNWSKVDYPCNLGCKPLDYCPDGIVRYTQCLVDELNDLEEANFCVAGTFTWETNCPETEAEAWAELQTGPAECIIGPWYEYQ